MNYNDKDVENYLNYREEGYSLDFDKENSNFKILKPYTQYDDSKYFYYGVINKQQGYSKMIFINRRSFFKFLNKYRLKQKEDRINKIKNIL